MTTHYQKHKESSIKSHKKWQESESGKQVRHTAVQKHKEKRRAWLFEFKCNNPCVCCGETNPLVLDLDHIDRSQKKFSIAEAINRGTKWADVLAEVEKCQVLCSNCHRMKSIIERDRYMLQDYDHLLPDYFVEFMSRSGFQKDTCEAALRNSTLVG